MCHFFWQFENAILVEICYVISNNPEMFFSKIPEDQWQNFINQLSTLTTACKELAKYDTEKASIYELLQKMDFDNSNNDFETNSAIVKLRNSLL